jgi:hypothetical protein
MAHLLPITIAKKRYHFKIDFISDWAIQCGYASFSYPLPIAEVAGGWDGKNV